jgi:hypothetical protein
VIQIRLTRLIQKGFEHEHEHDNEHDLGVGRRTTTTTTRTIAPPNGERRTANGER